MAALTDETFHGQTYGTSTPHNTLSIAPATSKSALLPWILVLASVQRKKPSNAISRDFENKIGTESVEWRFAGH